MSALLTQMAAFTVLFLIGYLALKGKLWQENELQALSKFLVNLGIPIMVLTSIPLYTKREDLFGAVPFLLVGICFVGVMYLGALVSAKLSKVSGNTKDIHIAESAFPNGTFVGLPIASAVLGPQGVFYWSIFTLIDHATVWTIGVYLASGRKPGQKLWKKIICPTTVSLVVAIILVLLGFQPSGKIFDTVHTVGSAIPFIAMIYIGGMLATFEAKSVFTTKSLYWLVGIKMLLMPFVVFLLTIPCLAFLPASAQTFFCLFAALPSIIALTMVASSSGSDAQYATKCVFITTVCCIITIPLVMYLVTCLQQLIV